MRQLLGLPLWFGNGLALLFSNLSPSVVRWTGLAKLRKHVYACGCTRLRLIYPVRSSRVHDRAAGRAVARARRHLASLQLFKFEREGVQPVLKLAPSQGWDGRTSPAW